MEKLQKQVRALRISVIILSILILGIMGMNAYLLLRGNNFKEINTGRINIVESDGTLRMAISNRKLQDPGSYDGKKISPRDRPAGMIFFNDQGDECGGLIYDGDKKSASMTYSFDQYKGDQIMQLQYEQDATGTGDMARSYGLKMWDRDDRFPTSRLMDYVDSLKKLNDTAAYKTGIEKVRAAGWLGKERMFVGKSADGDYGIIIKDTDGKPRLRIVVNKQNEPVIEAIDKNGMVKSR